MADTKSAEPQTVRLPRDLMLKVKSIATHEEKTIVAVLVAAAKPGIDRKYRDLIRREAAELGGEAG